MSGIEFWRTPMGRDLIDRTMPKLANQLERLNTTLERVAEALLPIRAASPSAPDLQASAPSPALRGTAGSGHTAPAEPLVSVVESIAAGYARAFTSAATAPGPAGARPASAVALEAALRAAFHLGVAAGQLAMDQDVPAKEVDTPATDA